MRTLCYYIVVVVSIRKQMLDVFLHDYQINNGHSVNVDWYRARLSNADIVIKRHWKAHTQAIRDIGVIMRPLTICTVSFDCMVRGF